MASNEGRGPKRGPMGGPPGMRGNGEKAKDFKSAIKRLFKELRVLIILILLACFLAFFSAGLSITTPNILSKLTDEIAKGLVVNTGNINSLTEKLNSEISENKLKEMLPKILDVNISQETITKIMTSSEVSDEDKKIIQNIISEPSMEKKNPMESLKMLEMMPRSVQNIILQESTYEGVTISTDDKIKIINMISENSEKEIPESLKTILFKDFELDGQLITVDDQFAAVNLLKDVKKDSDTSTIFSKIDQLPNSIKSVVEPKMDMNNVKKITIILVLLYVASALFSYLQSIIMANVSNNFAKQLRSKISEKINRLPLKYFDRHQTGDILSRVTNDVDTIAQSMNQSLATLVSSITLFLGTMLMMFLTNWIMALTAIFSSLIGFVGMISVLKRSQKYFVARQENLGDLNGHIEEIYSGLNVVKVYNGKKKADEKFDILNKKVAESNQKSQFLSGLMHPLMAFIGNFGYVAVCIVGALLTMNNVITFGVIVAFITYVRLFTSPLSQIAQAMTALQSTAAASERVFEFLDEEEMSSQKDIKSILNKDDVKGCIEFKNVVFQYDNNDKPTINNFTATANPGQKVAIVGPTGAGKTTMVNLLMKFYDINSGDIKIDGVSTKNLSRENIHELFTMVLQDTWLFNGTIKENIVYNRENVSYERVKEVCKEVGLHHFIKTLPHGYDTILSDNDSVSSGQRQLLTIARGMIADSPFLILDEATSNVDTRTEELVQRAMDKLAKGKTSFIIAHRLSTIKNADLILVMKDGNIVEQGNHEELISKNGFYADLYNSQFDQIAD